MYQTERAIIGSILINTEYALPIAIEKVKPEDFTENRCKVAYECMLRHKDGGAIDPILLAGEMEDAGEREVGEWIVAVLNGTPTASNCEGYCDQLRKESAVRRLQTALDGSEGIGELVDSVNREVDALNGIIHKREVKTSLAMYTEFMEYYENVSKDPNFGILRTGYNSLDEKLGGGLVKGGFYVIGARPGMGKTTLALNIAEQISAANKPVLYVSLEMTAVQIMAKRIGIAAKMPYKGLLTASLSEEQERKMIERVNAMGTRPFFLYDGDTATVSGIATAAYKIDGLACIIVDYLGLLQTPNTDKKLYEQVTEISRDIKRLALQMNIPIIALCQLNRQSTQTSSKKPSLADLRDSGAIEQDADGVLLLYRADYFTPKEEQSQHNDWDASEMEINIAKNRHGDSGIVKMSWYGTTGIVKEMSWR